MPPRRVYLLLLLILGALSCLSRAEDILLKCDEFERVYESVDAFCTVSGFTVSHSQIVKIVQYPKANMTKFMKFYDSRLLYLPFKLFEVFTNLKTLDVSFTEILDISRNAFASANNLSYLNMSNNNITQITTSVFMGANSLIRIDLSRNLISDINEFAFRGLEKIDKIQLSNNQIRNISKDIFLENVYLETVALDNNLIEYIEPEVFSRLRRIRDVNLSNNRISRIHPNTFQAAYGLETLQISANNLSEFQLDNKSILVRLNLDNNNLTSLAVNSTKYVRAEANRISSIQMLNANYLEKLQLAWNNFSDISNITNLTVLQYLDLSHNAIGPLNITTFDKLKRLKELYLRATAIPRITYGMFSKQTSLEILDLSFNNMTELNLDIFVPYMSKIKNFYIDGNNLTEIRGKMPLSYAFPGLVKIGLSQNQFNCSYLHYILTPPYLSTFVELHIEPVASAEESSHIRDITCLSSRKLPAEIEKESQQRNREQTLLMQTVENLKLHEHKLEIYLLLMKISMLAMVCLALGVIVVKMVKVRRPDYFSAFERRAGSIVFRSTATVNTSMDH